MSPGLRPNTNDIREVVEQRLAAAEAQSGVPETVTVEWRGNDQPLAVITMPVELLAYNPDSHRLRAQRSLDPARDSVLTTDPWGSGAQTYLHELLRADPTDPSKVDPAFDELKDDLSQHGQKEPGVIDRSGVLVNGNTRRAALADLGEQHMRVGVLPADAGHEDVQSVELALQLRKIIRREYSFMNRLLAIEERVEAGWPREKILREFHTRGATFERNLWILSVVREAIERSKANSASGNVIGLRFVDFETHQGKLEELHRAYSTLKNRSPDEAEALKEQRLLAIAREKSKTDVRLIESDFADKYPKMKKLVRPSVDVQERTVPGTDIVATAPSAHVHALRELTTRVLQARAVALAPDDFTLDHVTAANEQLAEVDAALEDALVQAGRDGRLKKRRYAPVDRLSDANEDLQLVIDAVADAAATRNFAADDLDDGLLTLRQHLVKLAQHVSRSDTNGGDGISWLKSLLQLTAEE
jgi:hypothetical protein